MSWAQPLDTNGLAARIRRHAVMMTSRGKSSHVGSILSMADIVAVLYGSIMRIDPGNPRAPERDRFVLSKGHAGGGVYAALAERGFFPVEMLKEHCANGGRLSGHVSHVDVPGVEVSTGSLGHGLAMAAGMALASQRRGKAHRVFTVLSDGELDEGSNWEAALLAAHHGLSNLIAVIDYNKIQSLTFVKDTLGLEPLADKWRSFGWDVVEVDGHDHAQLLAALNVDPRRRTAPRCVIAHTVKGKGVSFMENNNLWHYRSPQGEELAAALNELGGAPNA